jgi:hypothetical protein
MGMLLSEIIFFFIMLPKYNILYYCDTLTENEMLRNDSTINGFLESS